MDSQHDLASRIVEDGLMSVRDAAHFVAISRSELYLIMERGELKYVKIGRRRLIPRRSLIDFAAWNVVPTGPSERPR